GCLLYRPVHQRQSSCGLNNADGNNGENWHRRIPCPFLRSHQSRRAGESSPPPIARDLPDADPCWPLRVRRSKIGRLSGSPAQCSGFAVKIPHSLWIGATASHDTVLPDISAPYVFYCGLFRAAFMAVGGPRREPVHAATELVRA